MGRVFTDEDFADVAPAAPRVFSDGDFADGEGGGEVPTPPARAPWYTERGINERLAPSTPTADTSFADRLLMPEMNASKQALRMLFGLAAHPIDSIGKPLAGAAQLLGGIPTQEAEAVRGELDRRGLGLDLSQTAGERYGKAASTLVEEPLTPALDVGIVAGGVKGAKSAAREWWLPREPVAAKPRPNYIESQLSDVIRRGYEKGVRPTVAGKGSFGKIESAAAKAQRGVEAIIKNKDRLKLTDQFGDTVKGLPQNLHQFTQAISQAKDVLFEKFDAMAKGAGHKGGTIDTTPIAEELNSVGGGKVQRVFAPETINYIAEKAKRLKGQTFTPSQAQEAIKMLNSSLEAYYKNPTFDTYSRAAIDEFIVRRLRDLTDTAISRLEGPGYQALKNEYGSLTAIEKEVAHRTIVDARKANKNLFDLTDVATAGELAKLLISPNPASLAKATVFQGVKYRMKLLNDPNRAVRNMFRDAEALMARRPAPVTPPLSAAELANRRKVAELREAEPARAAAEQAAWKEARERHAAERQQAAEAAAKANLADLSKSAAEREAARNPVAVEANRAAAEQAAWKAEKEAAAAKTAETTRRSGAEISAMAKNKEPVVIDRTFEGIPKDRTIVLDGLTEEGKKFSYKENARTAYTETKRAVESLSKASEDMYEGEGSLLRTLKKHGVEPVVRTQVMRRVKGYLKEGLSKDDAAIAAIGDIMREWDSAHKDILRQLGIDK